MNMTVSALAQMLRLLPGALLFALVVGAPLMALQDGRPGMRSIPQGGAGFVLLVSLQRAG